MAQKLSATTVKVKREVNSICDNVRNGDIFVMVSMNDKNTIADNIENITNYISKINKETYHLFKDRFDVFLAFFIKEKNLEKLEDIIINDNGKYIANVYIVEKSMLSNNEYNILDVIALIGKEAIKTLILNKVQEVVK